MYGRGVRPEAPNPPMITVARGAWLSGRILPERRRGLGTAVRRVGPPPDFLPLRPAGGALGTTLAEMLAELEREPGAS